MLTSSPLPLIPDDVGPAWARPPWSDGALEGVEPEVLDVGVGLDDGVDLDDGVGPHDAVDLDDGLGLDDGVGLDGGLGLDDGVGLDGGLGLDDGPAAGHGVVAAGTPGPTGSRRPGGDHDPA